MLSAKAAIQHSSARRVLSLTPPCPPPCTPIPGHLRHRRAHPGHPCAEHGASICCLVAKATHTSSPLAGERLSASSPNCYSCNFGGKKPLEQGGQASPNLAEEYLRSSCNNLHRRHLFKRSFFKMLFPMLKVHCLQSKAKFF